MPRKSRSHQLDLPPLELECMKALWALGEATVHQIRKQIEPQRPLAYTTVMTVMNRLALKGVASREKRGRMHLYRPAIEERAVRSRAVERLIDSFFEGSSEKLLEYLKEPFIGRNAGGQAAKVSELAIHRPAQEAGDAADEVIDPSLL